MGVFDTYGPDRVQNKSGYCSMGHYDIGDDVPMKEGVFASSDGLIIVKGHILVATIKIAGLNDARAKSCQR